MTYLIEVKACIRIVSSTILMHHLFKKTLHQLMSVFYF